MAPETACVPTAKNTHTQHKPQWALPGVRVTRTGKATRKTKSRSDPPRLPWRSTARPNPADLWVDPSLRTSRPFSETSPLHFGDREGPIPPPLPKKQGIRKAETMQSGFPYTVQIWARNVYLFDRPAPEGRETRLGQQKHCMFRGTREFLNMCLRSSGYSKND